MASRRKKLQYQQLMRVALVLTLICAGVAIYAIVKYTGADHATRLKAQTDLTSTYTYFDWNRKQAPIQYISWTRKSAAGVAPTCPSGYLAEALYKWPGTAAGYVDSAGKYFKGVSTTYTAIPAKPAQNANYWKWGAMCTKRVVAGVLTPSTNGAC